MRLASAIVFSLLIPAAAHADPFDFTINPVPNGGGTYSLSFELPQSPATTQNAGDGYFSVDTNVTGGGLDGPTTILFINTNLLNGAGDIQFILDANNSNQVLFSGDILFSGNENDPTFLAGQYALVGGVDGNNYTLNVHPASPSAVTPEPSSILLLSTGIALMALQQRRRFLSKSSGKRELVVG